MRRTTRAELYAPEIDALRDKLYPVYLRLNDRLVRRAQR